MLHTFLVAVLRAFPIRDVREFRRFAVENACSRMLAVDPTIDAVVIRRKGRARG